MRSAAPKCGSPASSRSKTRSVAESVAATVVTSSSLPSSTVSAAAAAVTTSCGSDKTHRLSTYLGHKFLNIPVSSKRKNKNRNKIPLFTTQNNINNNNNTHYHIHPQCGKKNDHNDKQSKATHVADTRISISHEIRDTTAQLAQLPLLLNQEVHQQPQSERIRPKVRFQTKMKMTLEDSNPYGLRNKHLEKVHPPTKRSFSMPNDFSSAEANLPKVTLSDFSNSPHDQLSKGVPDNETRTLFESSPPSVNHSREDLTQDEEDYSVTLEDVAQYRKMVKRKGSSNSVLSSSSRNDDVWSYTNTTIATEDIWDQHQVHDAAGDGDGQDLLDTGEASGVLADSLAKGKSPNCFNRSNSIVSVDSVCSAHSMSSYASGLDGDRCRCDDCILGITDLLVDLESSRLQSIPDDARIGETSDLVRRKSRKNLVHHYQSPAQQQFWDGRKRSDGAGIMTCVVADSTSTSTSASSSTSGRGSPPSQHRERLFELLIRHTGPQCEVCVSWNRRHPSNSCSLCAGRLRRGSDPYSVPFNRILSAEEHRELMGILGAKQHLGPNADDEDDETSGWRKVKNVVQWSPFIQTYRHKRYQWVQLAGHSGNFKTGQSEGTIMKKLCKQEEACYELLAEDSLRDFVPQYQGTLVTDDDEKFIQLQDCLSSFTLPSIMDCKIGVRTYLEEELEKAKEKPKLRKDMYDKMIAVDPDAPSPEEHEMKAVTKPRYMVWRETISSTATLGFRIEGVKNNSDGTSSKDFKTTKTKDQVLNVFRSFLNTKSSSSLAKQYLSRLLEIRDALTKSKFFQTHEFIGSSLLFIHDEEKVGIWLIDFGKTVPLPDGVHISHDSDWEVGNHEDGYLIGIDNLIELFTNLCQILNGEEAQAKTTEHPGEL